MCVTSPVTQSNSHGIALRQSLHIIEGIYPCASLYRYNNKAIRVPVYFNFKSIKAGRAPVSDKTKQDTW